MTERKPIVVMKFGGTSVADSAGRAAIAARVQAALELGRAPVLVVSAMGYTLCQALFTTIHPLF